MEVEKPKNPEKNPRNRDKNQQLTQPTYDAGSGNRTQATLVGGERSQHCRPHPCCPAAIIKDLNAVKNDIFSYLALKFLEIFPN